MFALGLLLCVSVVVSQAARLSPVDDSAKIGVLKKYAPRTVLHSDEVCGDSSERFRLVGLTEPYRFSSHLQ